jgi:transcriptional regulator with XRE-family HTH domain
LTTDIRVLFGQNLRKIRLEKNISQEELAFRSGLHRTYVSSVERGERNISLENIEKLAHALKIPTKDLIPEERKS